MVRVGAGLEFFSLVCFTFAVYALIYPPFRVFMIVMPCRLCDMVFDGGGKLVVREVMRVRKSEMV